MAKAIDLDNLTLVDAVAAICEGRFSSTSLVEASLAKARARLDLNAFAWIDEEGARAAAARYDAARASGEPGRPLGGVPIVVKDSIEVAGVPNRAGTPSLASFVPRNDAPVVAKLRAAGAIILGKTTLHEMSFGVSGYNAAGLAGAPEGVRNAYDQQRIAGGSSSGNGAAIGARIVTAALGTDTGGSVRIPAAMNGCAALRPTVGRYDHRGVQPVSATRDTVGTMAATVGDVALLDRLIAGGPAIGTVGLEGVRFGVAADMLLNLDRDTSSAFASATERLEAAGATLIEIDMPDLTVLRRAAGARIVFHEAHRDLPRYLAAQATGVGFAELSERIASADVKALFDAFVTPGRVPDAAGQPIDGRIAYRRAMGRDRPRLQSLYADAFSRHTLDAIVFPTVPRVAIAAGLAASSAENFDLIIQNTDAGSLAGLPGLQIPIAIGDSSGLPVGLGLDAMPGKDRHLLAIGLAVEVIFGRLPPPTARR